MPHCRQCSRGILPHVPIMRNLQERRKNTAMHFKGTHFVYSCQCYNVVMSSIRLQHSHKAEPDREGSGDDGACLLSSCCDRAGDE